MTLQEAISKALATSLGAGYSPIAPGTMGTAVTVPLAFALAPLAWWQFLLVTAAVTAVGIWAAGAADKSWGTHDSGRIVIDETAGYLLTVAFVDRSDWAVLLLGFVVFRAFDIIKPPPVRWIDKNVGGGTGVVLDDVAAGVQSVLVMLALVALELPRHLHSLVP